MSEAHQAHAIMNVQEEQLRRSHRFKIHQIVHASDFFHLIHELSILMAHLLIILLHNKPLYTCPYFKLGNNLVY